MVRGKKSEAKKVLDKMKFLAGSSSFDISPDPSRAVYMAGFEFNRRSIGIHDPIYAKALYLNDGKNELALVSLDLIGIMNSDARKIRELVKTIPPDNIIVCCIHNHASPDTIGFWGPSILRLIPRKSGIDPDYQEEMIRKTAECIGKAKEKAQPAMIKFYQTEISEQGLVTNVRQENFYDKSIEIMKVENEKGENIATLVNLACHPETLWEHNRLISADFAGYMYKTIEEKLGGVALLFQGALGGMVTHDMDEEVPLSERWNFVKYQGRRFGEMVLEAVSKETEIYDSPRITIRKSNLSLPLANFKYWLVAKFGVIERDFSKNAVETEMYVIDIGPAQIITAPGELLPSVGFKMKQMMTAKYKFIFSLAQDELGYILDREYFKKKNYWYEQSMSVGPETAPIIYKTIESLLSSHSS